MKENKSKSGNQSSNRPKRSIKNNKKSNIENDSLPTEKYDIVFIYKGKRSIKNNKKIQN